MARIPIALQLWSIREDCGKDLPGTLQAVAEMGYEGVEFAGYYDYSAEELRQILDDIRLAVAGTHIDLDTLLGDELPATIEFNEVLGNQFLIVPGLPEERRDSRAAWRQTAQIFNEISEKVHSHNMWVGYHNHYIEFTEMEGELPWDTFFSHTVDEVVMQLDTGNALRGGGQPVALLEQSRWRAARGLAGAVSGPCPDCTSEGILRHQRPGPDRRGGCALG